MIRAVLFDFGGVLTESGRRGFIGETLAELYGQDPKTMQYGDVHYLFRRGKGGDDDKLFEELNARYGKQVTKEMFLERVHAEFHPSVGVYELAEALRSHGIRTGILSNIFSMNANELREQGWYDGFDPVLLSCEAGYAKPDQEFYQLALDTLGLPPEEILFIDDQQKCTEPAEAMGMHTVLAASPEQIVTDTKAIVRRENNLEL